MPSGLSQRLRERQDRAGVSCLQIQSQQPWVPLFLLAAGPAPPGFQNENVMRNSCKDWEAVKGRSEGDLKYDIYM